eukprot:evm.model.scf_4847.1 EVM.evm.TU.scf_4847.1   scf_4847:2119-2445(-)
MPSGQRQCQPQDAAHRDGCAISAGRRAGAAGPSTGDGLPSEGLADPRPACCSAACAREDDDGSVESARGDRCRVCLEGVAGGDLEGCGALRLGCRWAGVSRKGGGSRV